MSKDRFHLDYRDVPICIGDEIVYGQANSYGTARLNSAFVVAKTPQQIRVSVDKNSKGGRLVNNCNTRVLVLKGEFVQEAKILK